MRRIRMLPAILACALVSTFLLLVAQSTYIPSAVFNTGTAPPTPMSVVRDGASSSVLSDGRVLISGGNDASGTPHTSVEFLGSGASAGTMTMPRSGHISVALKDDTVLLAGGTTTGGAVTNAAEIFNPATGASTAIASLLVARAGATATLLSDGSVLIAGGKGSGSPLQTMEIFDPVSAQFSNAAPMTVARQNHAAALLSDGRVLLVGGSDGANPLASVEVYDPVAKSVSALPNMSTARTGLSATTMLKGKVLLAGGGSASTEILDPVAGSISPGPSMTVARTGHLALLLPNNNTVLMVAGSDSAAAEIFVPWAANWHGAFAAFGIMANPRTGASSGASGQSGIALVAGGQVSGAASNTVDVVRFPMVKTDKEDYAPGETVTITGSGFQPGETVNLVLEEVPYLDTHGPFQAVAGADGSFSTTQFAVDAADANIRFYLSATGMTSGLTAGKTFTDSVGFNGLTVGAQSPGTVPQGGSATYTITVKFNGNGSGTCTVGSFSISGAPAGVTAVSPADFSPSSVTSTDGTDKTVTMTVHTTGATPVGNYTGGSAITVAASGTAGNCNGTNNNTKFNLSVGNPTTLTLAAPSPASVTSGSAGPVTLTATLTRTSGGAGVNSQTITFKVDGTTVGTGTSNSSGLVTFSYNPSGLGVGPHTVQAFYDGGTSASILHGASTSGTQTLTVTSANTAPTAASQSVSTAEDTPLLITLSGTDTSPAALTFSIVTPPSAASGNLGSLGAPSCSLGTCTATVTFTPTANYNGPASFTFKTNDGSLDSTTNGTVSITVTPVNDVPVAADGSFSGPEDGGAIALDLGPLVSDLETSDANLTYTIVTPPASGTMGGSGQNRTFTPAANFNGQVTFTYKVTDRGDPDNCGAVTTTCAAALESAIKTVTITVNPVNDKPVANDFSTASIPEDSVVGVSFDLSAHVSDVETANANLTYHIVAGPTPAQGTLTGTLPIQTFVPAANFNGTVSITYNVTDRGDPDNCGAPGASCTAPLTSDTKTVTIVVIPVNDAPVANDGSFSGPEDGGAIALDLGPLVSDLETSDANLTYTIVTPPASGTMGGSGQNRTFTPAANFNGQVTFTYKVMDRGDPDNCGAVTTTCAAALESAIKTVTITVNPVNDKPVANDFSTASIPEDSVVGVSFDLSAHVSDVETANANLTYNIVAGPTPAQGTLTGTLPIQTFVPAANFNGTVSITYNVTDRGDPDNCGAPSASCTAPLTSDTKTVTIVVIPVNDAPVANDGSFSGPEDGGAIALDLGPLVSDLETSDANLTYTIVTPPASGTMGGSGQNRTFTPAANFNGQVTFTYKVMDRGDPDNCGAVTTTCAAALESAIKTVTITVNPVNDKPVANDFSTASIPEDSVVGVSFDLSAHVSDVETANANLTYNIVAGPTAAQGTLSGTGANRTFVPAANFNGTVSITYNVTDRGDPDNCGAPSASCTAPLTSDTKTVTIVVTPVNDAPVANDGSFSGPEDGGAIALDLGTLVSDIETSDANLTYTIVTPPASGTMGGSGQNRTFTPAANFNGQVTFTYKVMDRGDPDNCGAVTTTCAAALESAIKTVTITVNPVNDKPVANDFSTASIPEDSVVGVSFDLSAHVSDVETANANLTYNIVAGPTAAQGTLSGTGANRTFVPAANFNGTVSITYNVTDRGDPDNCGAPSASCTAPLTSDTKTVTIVVTPVNDAPVANDGTASTLEDNAVIIDLGAFVSDIETAEANLTYVIDTNPTAAQGVLSGTGSSRTFTPTLNYNGTATFTYHVVDRGDPDNCGAVTTTCAAALTSLTKTVTITITPVNDAPVVYPLTTSALSILENGSVTISGTFTDPDIGDTHVVTVDWGDGSSSTLPGLSAGVFAFGPVTHTYLDDNPTGTTSDTYNLIVSVRDAGIPLPVLSGSMRVTVTVANVAPEITGITAPGPTPVGTPLSILTNFNDPGTTDTFTCVVTWDDAVTSTGTGAASATNPKACTAARTFTAAGVFGFSVSITDDDTGSDSEAYSGYAVAYDPNGGFVTGGGWITSPAGAYLADSSLTGKATFGFVSKYLKGANVPTGETEFQYKVGNLSFHSTVYEWLVVAGTKAQYKGSGTINGGGNYGFLLTAKDGSPDTFRMKIWDKNNGDTIVYDSGLAGPDDIDTSPMTALGGGSIVVHK